MGISVVRFPEFGVALHIHSGPYSGEDLVRHYQSLGAADALRWIHYYDATAATWAVDLAVIPELKRVIAVKRGEIFGDESPASVVVYGEGAGANEAFFSFWRSYAEADEPHVTPPLVFPTLAAACEGLSLPEAARAALEAAVQPFETRAAPG
jgi:hypothetical protein